MNRRKQSSPILVILIILFGVGALIATIAAMQSLEKSQAKTSKLTLANFNRVQQGMTKAEVIGLLGAKHTTQMSMDFGVNNKGESLKWLIGRDEEGGFAVVNFQNGECTTKMQYALP